MHFSFESRLFIGLLYLFLQGSCVTKSIDRKTQSKHNKDSDTYATLAQELIAASKEYLDKSGIKTPLGVLALNLVEKSESTLAKEMSAPQMDRLAGEAAISLPEAKEAVGPEHLANEPENKGPPLSPSRKSTAQVLTYAGIGVAALGVGTMVGGCLMKSIKKLSTRRVVMGAGLAGVVAGAISITIGATLLAQQVEKGHALTLADAKNSNQDLQKIYLRKIESIGRRLYRLRQATPSDLKLTSICRTNLQVKQGSYHESGRVLANNHSLRQLLNEHRANQREWVEGKDALGGKVIKKKFLGKGSFGKVYSYTIRSQNNESIEFAEKTVGLYTAQKEIDNLKRFIGDPYFVQYLGDRKTAADHRIYTELAEATFPAHVEQNGMTHQHFVDASRILKTLSEKNLFHGDIKPSNLFIKDGRLILGDLATVISVSNAPLSKRNQHVRTALYTDAYSYSVSPASDMYSMGITLLKTKHPSFFDMLIKSDQVKLSRKIKERKKIIGSETTRSFQYSDAINELLKKLDKSDDPYDRLILQMVHRNPHKRITPVHMQEALEKIRLGHG